MMTRGIGGWPLLLCTLFVTTPHAAEFEGEVRWGEPLTLSTSLAAEVVQATARSGEQLKKGALLVQLEDGVFRAELAAARAEVAHQKLLLAEARNELQRSEELYERTLLSDHDLDLARIAHAGANSSYQQAVARVAAAERALAQTQITAPFDAVVLARHVQVGATVNGRFHAAPLYTLVAAQERVVRLLVAARQAPGVMPGAELALQLGERRYRGRVAAITHHGEPGAAPQMTIDILFTPAAGDAVAIGEVARVTLP
jgi:multidrug efflux system membrane fusion protein